MLPKEVTGKVAEPIHDAHPDPSIHRVRVRVFVFEAASDGNDVSRIKRVGECGGLASVDHEKHLVIPSHSALNWNLTRNMPLVIRIQI